METILLLAVSAIVVLLLLVLSLQKNVNTLQDAQALQLTFNKTVVDFQVNQSQVINPSLANGLVIVATELDKITKEKGSV